MERMTRNQTGGIRSACNDRHDGRCACGGNGSYDIEQKLRRINFALYETILYLDAYPDCVEALAYYHSLLQTKKALMEEYQSKIGPLTAFGNQSATSWDWVQTPWPWE